MPHAKEIRVTEIVPELETLASIKVVGVGGSGNSAVNRMVELGIRGVEFIAINTDAQALQNAKAPIKVHIGKTVTKGLGAGMDPQIGRRAAEESGEEIHATLNNADMVFITCGLGGGTGTGASPIIANIARDLGALTVAVVTKPFNFEGSQRRLIAEQGFHDLAEKVDAIISIPNDRLLQIIDKKTSLVDAFATVDEILRQGVQGISEIITVPGRVNVDFNDVKAIMKDSGSALMGIGIASGETRAADAAKAAIDSPLLEQSIDGAKGILFTVAGNASLGMYELNEAAHIITKQADPNAKIIFGTILDESLGDEVKVTVVATGFANDVIAERQQSREIKSSFSSQFAKQEQPRHETVQERQKPASSSVFYPQDEPVIAHKPSAPQSGETKTFEEEDEIDIPTFLRKKMG